MRRSGKTAQQKAVEALSAKEAARLQNAAE